METSKTARLISNIFYLVGLVIFFLLLGFVLFGANYIPYPDAMIPFSMRDTAFIGLAAGAVPMLLACAAVYEFNGIKISKHKKRDFILLFSPGFLCGLCLLAVIGIFVIMMVQGMPLIGNTGA